MWSGNRRRIGSLAFIRDFQCSGRPSIWVAVIVLAVLLIGAPATQAQSPPTFAFQLGGSINPASGEGQFNNPLGVAIDPSSGDVYVADCGNDRVQKFDPSGHFLLQFHGVINCPIGVAVDPSSGDVIVTGPRTVPTCCGPTNAATVERFDASGNSLSAFGNDVAFQSGGDPSGFTPVGPNLNAEAGVAVDPSTGNLYVADGNSGVYEFTSAGAQVSQLLSASAVGVAVDPTTADLYVTEYSGDDSSGANLGYAVAKYDAAGNLVSTFGSPGTGNGQFSLYVDGVAVDGAGNVYVVDNSGSRVEEFDASGTYLTQFGSNGYGSGQFRQPYGVAVDAATGAIWVTDPGYNRVEAWQGAPSTGTTSSAPDGSGSASVSPSQVVAGSTGDTLVFTYTAATGGTTDGVLRLTLPSGWSAPSMRAADPGYTIAIGGSGADTVDTSGRDITVSGVTLATGDALTVSYGDTSGGGPGATAGATVGPVGFPTAEASTASGTLTALQASPSLNVLGTQSITFTSTPPNPGIVGTTYLVSAAGGASGNPVTLSIDPSSTAGACSLAGNTVSFTDSGNCVVDANEAGTSGSYLAAPQVQQTIPVRIAQRLTFTSTPPYAFPNAGEPAVAVGSTYVVSATGGDSGNPVVLSIDSASAGACSLAGNTVSFTSFGSCFIDANQAGTSDAYLAAPQVQQIVEVWALPPDPIPASALETPIVVKIGDPPCPSAPTTQPCDFSMTDLGTVSVSIPAGALPAGTAVFIYPANYSTSNLDTLMDFVITWVAPDGTVPVASAPITATITGSTFKNGDVLWQFTGANEKLPVGVFLNGQVSASFTTDPAYALSTPEPPTASAGGGTSGYGGIEGTGIDLTGTAADVDGLSITTQWSATANTGTDGRCAFADATVLDTTVTCTDDGSYTLTLTADDGVNPAVTSTAQLAVGNAPIAVGAISGLSTSPVAINATVSADARFTDPGTADAHAATWDWGDGTTSAGIVSETVGTGTGIVSGSHTYSAAGVYTVTLTVSDQDRSPGTGSASFQYEVVYDPSAGFVTGGGWINSPTGADPANPSLSGPASFSFVAKYHPGNNSLTGQIEFQFQLGNLNFHSSGYDNGSLVISESLARYTGTGTINGAGTYDFLVEAHDCDMADSCATGPDGFRIEITDPSHNNAVIYDNVPGGSGALTQANTESIAQGDIVIHTH